MRPVVLALALALASPAMARHLGDRVQWQPEIADLDARLAQSVEIEIIGRAAVPALEILSEATGVSLSVAPEDLATVGERKLTVISKGLALKAILVQIPEALQECHWDIEPSGSDFIYYLHRNGNAEQAMAQLREGDSLPLQRARRQRLEEARAALKMSKAELVKLEETDLYLARVMKEPHARARLEAFLALPPRRIEDAVNEGETSMKYTETSPAMQQAIIELVEDSLAWIWETGTEARPRAELLSDLVKTTITFRWWSPDAVSVGFNVQALPDESNHIGRFVIPVKRAPAPDVDVSSFKEDAGPPGAGMRGGRPRVMRRAVWQASAGPLHHLLRATGTESAEEAERIILQASANYLDREQEREEARRQQERVLRDDPDLQQLIDPEEVKFPDLAAFQLWLANETGLSIVSDYFSRVMGFAPGELRSEERVPLWRLLYAMGDRSGFRWQKVGRCLRFHHAKWYERVQSEVPEALLFSFLRTWHSGTLALEDVVSFVASIADRPRVYRSLPIEAQFAHAYRSAWAVQTYGSLTPEQRAAARSPEGVRVSDMSAEIRSLILARAVNPNVVDARSRDDYAQATFHVEETHEHSEESGQSWDLQRVRLFLKLPDGRTDESRVALPRTETEITYVPLVHASELEGSEER